MELPTIFIGRKLSLLTRNWLESEQVRFLEEPLIRITYRKPDIHFFNLIRHQAKKWVITSSYAAHWLLRFGDKICLKNEDLVYCLSEKQEGILTNCGQRVARPDSPSARSLAELIIQQDNESKVIYLRGDKSLNELPDLLIRNQINWHSVEVYKNTSIEIILKEVFDGYLFFSPSAIKSYKDAGNFPPPKADIHAIGNTTALMAWKEFPNKVLVSPEQEELSFVKYAIKRIQEKLNTPEPKRKVHYF